MKLREDTKKAAPSADSADQQDSATSYFDRFFNKKDQQPADTAGATDDVTCDELVLRDDRPGIAEDEVLDADYDDGGSEVPGDQQAEDRPRPPPGASSEQNFSGCSMFFVFTM